MEWYWPFKQHKTSRDQKLVRYHEELKKGPAGVCGDMKDLCGFHKWK